jgi:hypothetical protein
MPKAKAKKAAGLKTKSKAVPKRKPGIATGVDFATTFAALKKVLAPFSDQPRVTADEPRKYHLVTQSKSWKGGPMFFGAVMMGKAYVSYHLMPRYTHPELIKTLSPELRKRMQGKSCFNFGVPDDGLFAELVTLTQAGREKYRTKNWL